MRSSLRYFIIAVALLTAYLVAPIPLRRGPIEADANSVGTLRDRGNRAGRAVTFGRVSYRARDDRHYLRTYTGEQLSLASKPLRRSSIVSVRATFVDDSTLVIRELHDHTGWPRDLMNYVGLTLVATTWLVALVRRRPRITPP